jgi:hypothetical protein
MTAMRSAGWTSEKIAEQLNREGFRPPRNRATFNGNCVNGLLRRLGLSGLCKHFHTNRALLLLDEWCIPDLAEKLRVQLYTAQRWRQRGWIHSRPVPGAPKRWFVWADRDEMKRLRRLRDYHSDSNTSGRYPKELTTPKKLLSVSAPKQDQAVCTPGGDGQGRPRGFGGT